MRAFEIREFGIDNLRIADRETPQPGHREVLVRMTAASLNYRDLMVVKGVYNPKMKRPMVPLSDGAGVIEAVGTGVTRFQSGDRVAGCFMQTWHNGPPSKEYGASALGGAIDGVLQEHLVFSEEGLVRIPSSLSDVEVASLPCAAVTAWHALFERASMLPGQTVLLQGTGGVSLFALQFAKMAGYETILLSSSDEKIERARAMGADQTINYKTSPEWDEEVRKATGGRGVDHVIEVGGSGTLPKSLRAAAAYGIVSVIGVLSGADNTVNPRAIMMNNLRVQGIYVGSRAMFESMIQAIVAHRIKPVIDRTFPWTEAPDALRYLESQQHMGKICLTF